MTEGQTLCGVGSVGGRQGDRPFVGPFVDVVPEHGFVVEDEAAAEGLAGEEEGEPVGVIGPHAVVGDGVDGGPNGGGFVSFGGGAGEVGGGEDVAEDVGAGGHGEPQLADFDGVGGGDVEFLLALADDGLKRGFTWFDFAAGAVDFAGTEAAFLLDQEDLAIADHEEKGGRHPGLPGRPVDGGRGRRGHR